jgi:hypothetical protein
MTKSDAQIVLDAKNLIGAYANLHTDDKMKCTFSQLLNCLWRLNRAKETMGYKCAEILASVLDAIAAQRLVDAEQEREIVEDWKDEPDLFTSDILKAHPTVTGDHETYEFALALVSNRHGKGSLVDLVNWLLFRLKCWEKAVGVTQVMENLGNALADLPEGAITDIEVDPTKPKPPESSLDTCPRCGGVADNGHDRSLPPNPYYCTKCTTREE